MPRLQRWLVLGPILFLAILLSACGRSPTLEVHAASTTPPDTTPRLREADDTARFVAGLPVATGSSYAGLEANWVWQEHRRLMDNAWHRAEVGLINGLREFQRRELSTSPISSATVFYPFSGPDALTIALCFPQSPVYVFVGLEPAGTLPTGQQLGNKDLEAYLAATRRTMASVLGRSFFVTREMDRQFRGQVTDGLMLPILHLLVRTDHTVLGFRYVRLDDNGEIIDREADYKAPTRFGNKGIEINYRTDADQSTHKLLYFCVNLSNERLRENQPFLTYLSRLKGATTVLKATSYMTHRANFSVIRDYMLANSAAILQDDSGIPYRCFQPGQWNVQLYGDYDRPYGSFKWLEQPDLRKAYRAIGPKPLSLRIGYGYSRIASNLLLARRAQ